jgi:hypothetical protein
LKTAPRECEAIRMADHCSACGAEIPENAAVCSSCGQPRRTTDPVDGERKPAPDAASVPAPSRTAEPPATDANPAGQTETDETLWVGGYSWRALLPQWLAATFLAVIAGAIGWPWVGWTSALFIALVTSVVTLGGVGLYLAYRRLSVVNTLTSHQFSQQTGLLARDMTSVDLVQIDDVAFDQSRFERWCGTGTIKLISVNAAAPELLLDSIGNPHRVAATINAACHAARIRGGWFIDPEQ